MGTKEGESINKMRERQPATKWHLDDIVRIFRSEIGRYHEMFHCSPEQIKARNSDLPKKEPHIGEIKLPIIPIDHEGEKKVDEFLAKKEPADKLNPYELNKVPAGNDSITHGDSYPRINEPECICRWERNPNGSLASTLEERILDPDCPKCNPKTREPEGAEEPTLRESYDQFQDAYDQFQDAYDDPNDCISFIDFEIYCEPLTDKIRELEKSVEINRTAYLKYGTEVEFLKDENSKLRGKLKGFENFCKTASVEDIRIFKQDKILKLQKEKLNALDTDSPPKNG